MEYRSKKGWLYLLPAVLFLGVFMVYPLIAIPEWEPTIFPMCSTTPTFCRP